jgi:hypothetical protein
VVGNDEIGRALKIRPAGPEDQDCASRRQAFIQAIQMGRILAEMHPDVAHSVKASAARHAGQEGVYK